MKRVFALVLLALVPVASWAQQGDATIRIARTIPYGSSAQVASNAARECTWDRELSERIVEYSRGLVEATDEDLATLPGRTLRVYIRSMRGIGGGMFTGPKYGAIRADLHEDGKLIGRFDAVKGSMMPINTACGTLSKIADALGADVAAWLRRGTFTVPVDAESASPIVIGPPETVPPIEH